MHLVFTIGNEIKYQAKLNLSLNELLPNYIKSRSNAVNKNTFKIPLNVNLNKKILKIKFIQLHLY